MKKKLAVYMFLLMSFFLLSDEIITEYGHVSFVKPNSKVIIERLNGARDKAIINLPIVPGDVIITKEKSRCEIQFNNGTIIRLDNNTSLKVVTILAKTLTSRKKITTLELLKGNVYIMAQVYNKEIFQIITENSAALFKKSTTAIIQFNENSTDFNVFRGTINVMYGKNIKSRKKERIKSKMSFTITPENNFVKSKNTNENKFLIWNNEINKDFDKLHFGKSKVPKQIYRYSKGIIRWAEKWSSRFGEWIYDDIFGYVWRPYDESFIYDQRPFFHAQFTTINNKLYCVPSQKWGWAPSQLGTWVFMKNSGWRWIPGSAFNGGIFSTASRFNSYFVYNNLNLLIDKLYGSLDLYYIYRGYGKRAWERAYLAKNGTIIKNKIKLPRHIKKIISKLNRSYLSKVKRSISQSKGIIKNNLQFKNIKRNNIQKPINISNKLNIVHGLKNPEKLNNSIKKSISKINFKDFNPDSKWALQKNVNIRYSSKSNSVICDNIRVYRKFLKNNSKYNSRSSYSNRGSSSGNSSKSSKSSHSSSGGSAGKKK